MRRVSLIVAPLLVASLIACDAARSLAAVPDAKSLVPAGAQRGTSVEVTATGSFAPGPVRVHVTGSGVRFEPTKTEGKFKVVVDAEAIVGTRWIRFMNDEGVSAARPFVVGTLAEVSETEPNDELTQAGEMGSEPKVVNGTLTKGEKGADVDSFRVHLAKGTTLVAALDANRMLGSPIDAVLQIVSSTGFVLAQNHDELGLDPRLVFSAPRDGDYFVRLFAFPSVPNSSIRFVGDPTAIYRLTLTTGPYVDFAFPPVVQAATASKVALHGWKLDRARTLEVPAVAATSLPVALTLTEPGQALVSVSDVPSIVEREPNELDAPQPITSPVVVAGRIGDPKDRDVYSLKVEKGRGYKLRVLSQSLGFPIDPLLRIVGTDNVQLLRSDDGKRGEFDVDAVYRAADDGEIRLIVEDLFGAYGERFVYLLEVRPIEPDFTLTLAMSEFFTSAGTALEIPVAVERVGEVNGDIEIRLEGLPAEFGDVAAVSAPKGDTAKKVTLKLTPTKPFEGLVRVVGTAKIVVPVKGNATSKEAAKPPLVLRRTATTKIASVPGAAADDALLVVGQAKKK